MDSDHSSVMELPWTGYDYGAQVTLPFSGLSGPWGVIVDAAGNVFITDRGLGRVVKLQTQSVNFGSVYVCAAGQTTPSPCSSTLTLNYNVTTNGTLGYAAGADTGRTQS
ncbi:MAG: hypothetical protein WDN23_05780 [Edaphobacter sp.]